MAMLAQGENTQDASARGPEHCLVADPENIMSISRGLFPKKYAFNKTFPRHPANIPLAADHPGAQCDHQIPLANAPVARPGPRSENRCWEKKMLMTFAGLTNAWLFQAQPSAHPCRKAKRHMLLMLSGCTRACTIQHKQWAKNQTTHAHACH